ncbi:uncharacterized protein LOC134845841 isoform X2 [Symsagittifera roscoffensis]|uniref:uncharacterized protein LOC134845841 isoform X2 n=1 Tax=Symsagittifera roscoffensis TaxID=84072 RepID=UPI00307C36D2
MMPKYQIFVDNEAGGNDNEDTLNILSNSQWDGGNNNDHDNTGLWDQAVRDATSTMTTNVGGGGVINVDSHDSASDFGRMSHAPVNNSNAGSELRLGSASRPSPDNKKKPISADPFEASYSKIDCLWKNSVFDFFNDRQYLCAIWFMIAVQIILLIFLCQHFSFIGGVQSRFGPGGSSAVSAEEKQVHRNLDLEENVRIGRQTFHKLMKYCHTFMCFEKHNSDFGSDCFCFSEVQRSWDTANELCTGELKNVSGKMVILDTDSKKDSFEAIIKEYFSAKPEDTHYSYYGPQFWLAAQSKDGRNWKWKNNVETQLQMVREEDFEADCLALRGDGKLEPKPCWPSYDGVDVGVICEKKVDVFNLPTQKIRQNESCLYYGQTNETLLQACTRLNNSAIADQLFCNRTTKKCYVFVKPHQLELSNAGGANGVGREYYHRSSHYGTKDWLENRHMCQKELGMDDLVAFNDIYEQEFVINNVRNCSRISHMDYLQVGASRYAIGNLNHWLWVGEGNEEGLDETQFEWVEGMAGVEEEGKGLSGGGRCLAAEMDKSRLDEYIEYVFFPGKDLPDDSSPSPLNKRPWFEFVDFHCTEPHNFICEFNPSSDKSFTHSTEYVPSVPLSLIHIILEKNRVVFEMGPPERPQRSIFFVPKEEASLHDADQVCQHAAKTNFFLNGPDRDIRHAEIQDEEEKQLLLKQLQEFNERLPDQLVSLAAKFDWEEKQFEWKTNWMSSLNISGISPSSSPQIVPYGRPSWVGYDYDEPDRDNYPLLALSAKDENNGVYELKPYFPPRYDYFYRNGYKAPILCRA